MKKLFAVLLVCTLLVTVNACGVKSGNPDPGDSLSSVSVAQDESADKKNKGVLTEKEALKLVKEQALKEYENDDTAVDKDSGQVLDQNEEAYIVGYDINDTVYGNHLYTEAFWIHKKTRQIKDVCSINEYYEGLIDVSKGESNF